MSISWCHCEFEIKNKQTTVIKDENILHFVENIILKTYLYHRYSATVNVNFTFVKCHYLNL